nr:hypothetical protein [Leifsonia naganoensis]
MNGVPDLESVTALATAAFRRRPNLGETLATACQFLGISVSIIDQESEADLMRRALARESVLASLDAINVGGGSIQVTSPTGLTHLLPFGIADLNRRFGLSKGPSEREVTACREFVAGQLPDWLGEFAYTGGERTYLESFGVPLQGIWCLADDFEIFAARMERWSNHDLESRSPYDARWMSGAIASNSIVIACLQRSGVHRFAPVDLNIAHGNS